MLAKRREDYQPVGFSVQETHLTFDLDPSATTVTNHLSLVRTTSTADRLWFDGTDIELLKVWVNGQPCTDYECHAEGVWLAVPETTTTFTVTFETRCNPKNNTTLEGLYFVSGAFCTQCEAEGFRRISYYLDRPDILASFTVTINGDAKLYPYMLSNGNKVAEGVLEDGRHSVTWHDPHNKPAYLFALVAGDFDCLKGQFTTMSGRDVALEFFVEKGRLTQAEHALVSLQKSMRWDEETFGLEYDLDVYMVVAVDFFNMGAMENKGLNVFNSKFVLAQPDSATDDDYFNIESIIAHEYFHNWTGNRVTCRDWFQLSLKEGLTVFRDQQFSTDMTSPLSNRIKQINVMRTHQFAEDASAMSHPIRPDAVVEMNNFYTVTVYDKGAEVIRMMHTLLGAQGFRKGMDCYFARHDGQAVTCDDFVNAMQDANTFDLTHFKRWYSQSGTPQISVEQTFDEQSNTLTVTLSQVTHPTHDQAEKYPLLMPVRYECITSTGQSLLALEDVQPGVVVLDQVKQTYTFVGADKDTVICLFSGFSAPVNISPYNDKSQWFRLLTQAHEPLTVWEAAQNLFTAVIVHHYQSLLGQTDSSLDNALNWSLLCDWIAQQKEQPELLAEVLSLPSTEQILQTLQDVDIILLDRARGELKRLLANNLLPVITPLYDALASSQTTYAYESFAMHQRRLQNVLLQYVVYASPEAVVEQFVQANNMTMSLGALTIAVDIKHEKVEWMLDQFQQQWSHDSVVMDKWFALHARIPSANILSKLDVLQAHPHFSLHNPNKVRATIGTFAQFNIAGFHAEDGKGYDYLADFVVQLDAVNPQVAARLVTPLTQWQRFNESRQCKMCMALKKIHLHPRLSNDVMEKVSKSLA